MENNGATKAPLTRLRRRISLEVADEIKSPLTPSTPTKKRGRAAAKPQLDNIDENTPINSPRKSRARSTAKDIETKPDTPYKLTPGRRSTRIISNTSITETAQIESPRALRASRRLSKAESDAETPTLTPTKPRNRRIRKSISNTDSSGDISNLALQQNIQETIQEETDISSSNKLVITNERKSLQKSSRSKVKNSATENTPETLKVHDQNKVAENTDKAKHSSSDLLISEKLSPLPQIVVEDHNDNTLATDTNKRRRTESLNISTKSENISISNFFSDNEGRKIKKKKNKVSGNILTEKENFQSKDQVDICFVTNSIKIEDNKTHPNNEIFSNVNFINQDEQSIVQTKIFIEDSNSCSLDKLTHNSVQETEDQCVPVVEPINEEKSVSEQKFTNKFLDKTLVCANESIGLGSKRDRTLTNMSCEPMDIDETLPENLTMHDYSKDNLETSKNGEASHLPQNIVGNAESTSDKSVEKDKSKRTPPITDQNDSIVNSGSSFNKTQTENNASKKIKKDNSELHTVFESSIKNKSKNKSKKSNKSLSEDEEALSSQKSLNESAKNVTGDYTNKNEIQDKFITPMKNTVGQNLGLTTSTPVDNYNKESRSNKNQLKYAKKSNEIELSDSDKSSDDSEKLIIEEAKDVCDDYESGDSLDEQEREYMEENEVVDKGVSLGTDTTDESSDDSDYDKDSFIVSSDEEDNELLSGSGDDLAMSDNELSMSKKSKSKYNKQKAKEQKQASREMYEARHGVEKDSSQEEPEQNKLVIKSIRHKRMRIDSSLTESKDVIETEISAIVNESLSNKQDPLETEIKIEPKTPHNSFNTSSHKITLHPDVEHVNIDENATLMKTNITHDPLQNMSEDDNSSLASENEEIKENYNLVLSNLNKHKHLSKSLTTGENKMPRKKTSIMEEINITNPKSNVKTAKPKNKEDDDSSSSDSIDLRLIFPDTNSDSDHSNGKSKKTKEECCVTENFIPLKRVAGKTNLRDGEDNEVGFKTKKSKTNKTEIPDLELNNENEKSLDSTIAGAEYDKSQSLSSKKNKNKIESYLTHAEQNINHSIDSKKNKKLSESSMTQAEQDINQSIGSKKNKKLSESSMTHAEQDINYSIGSKKNKKLSESSMTHAEQDINHSIGSKKNKKLSETSITHAEQDIDQSIGSKKNKKLSESSMTQEEQDIDQSIGSKKNKKLSESSMTQAEQNINHSIDSKKNKKLSESSITHVEQDIDQSIGSKKNKKLSDSSMTLAEQDINQSIGSKKNKKLSESSMTHAEQDINQSKGSKKNKKLSESSMTPVDQDINQSIGSKKNKKLSESSMTHAEQDINQSKGSKKNKKLSESSMTPVDQDINQSIGSKKNKKLLESSLTHAEQDINQTKGLKRNKKSKVQMDNGHNQQVISKKMSESSDAPEEILTEVHHNEELHSNKITSSHKKNKNKTGAETDTKENEDVNRNLDSEISVTKASRKSLKRKASNSLTETDANSLTQNNTIKINKKRKVAEFEVENQTNTNSPKKLNRKRKQIPENQGAGNEKILSSFLEKLPVPRLPTTILDQLDEKAIKNKPKVLATTDFAVESTTKKKNKPSQFLEESIYLNSQSPQKKRRKEASKKPKVLPNIPTACTSGSGFTSNFKINIIPKEVIFVAQSSEVNNFKIERINNIKKSASKYKPKRRTANINKY